MDIQPIVLSLDLYIIPSSLSSSLSPSVVTYNTLIDGFQRSGKFQLALEVFQTALREKKADAITFNNFIDACGFHNQLDLLNGLLKDMKLLKLDISTNIYNSVIEAMARKEKFNEAIDLFIGLEMNNRPWQGKQSTISYQSNILCSSPLDLIH